MTKYLNLRFLAFIRNVPLGKLIELDRKGASIKDRSEDVAAGVEGGTGGRVSGKLVFSNLPVRPIPNAANFKIELGPWNWLFRLFYMFVSNPPKVDATPWTNAKANRYLLYMFKRLKWHREAAYKGSEKDAREY